VTIYSDSSAPESTISADKFQWETSEKFRNFDITDFAELLDAQGAPVDSVNCTAAATPTPTPTPRTPTPTPTSTPQGGAGNLPPTGDGISTGGGSALAWALVALGAVITLAASGYVLYGRSKRRPTD